MADGYFAQLHQINCNNHTSDFVYRFMVWKHA